GDQLRRPVSAFPCSNPHVGHPALRELHEQRVVPQHISRTDAQVQRGERRRRALLHQARPAQADWDFAIHGSRTHSLLAFVTARALEAERSLDRSPHGDEARAQSCSDYSSDQPARASARAAGSCSWLALIRKILHSPWSLHTYRPTTQWSASCPPRRRQRAQRAEILSWPSAPHPAALCGH